MNTLYLLRHSLTEANEKRLYCGSTDLPLSEEGRAIATRAAGAFTGLTGFITLTSGLRRADETCALLTGRQPDRAIPDLREMDFGAFEMQSYETLRHDPDYVRWIEDASGGTPCPGGESTAAFRARARRGGDALLALEADALAVTHGGVIVALMQHWFPKAGRNYYEWQPGPCGGFRVLCSDGKPLSWESL